MPFQFDQETRAIELAAGDTADLYIADGDGAANGHRLPVKRREK